MGDSDKLSFEKICLLEKVFDVNVCCALMDKERNMVSGNGQGCLSRRLNFVDAYVIMNRRTRFSRMAGHSKWHPAGLPGDLQTRHRAY
jgi:hypothetical protein